MRSGCWKRPFESRPSSVRSATAACSLMKRPPCCDERGRRARCLLTPRRACEARSSLPARPPLTVACAMRSVAGVQIGKAGAPVSHISQAYPDRVEVRGRDLCGDLMGRLSFTEYFHLLLTGQRADRGPALLPRSAPGQHRRARHDADQRRCADDARRRPGLAAGCPGGGDPRRRPGDPRHLRAVRAPARREAQVPPVATEPREIVEEIHAAGGKVPGFGHPVHRPVDPRAERILELADERGVERPARRARPRVSRSRSRRSGASR